MILLTNEEKESYEKQKVCYMCENRKVKDHCHNPEKCSGSAHNICNLIYKIPGEILVTFHNGSIYDYHFKLNH